MVRHLGAIVGVGKGAEELALSYERRLFDHRNEEKTARANSVF